MFVEQMSPQQWQFRIPKWPRIWPGPASQVMPCFLIEALSYLPDTKRVLNIIEKRYREMYSDILFNGSRVFVVAFLPPDGLFSSSQGARECARVCVRARTCVYVHVCLRLSRIVLLSGVRGTRRYVCLTAVPWAVKQPIGGGVRRDEDGIAHSAYRPEYAPEAGWFLLSNAYMAMLDPNHSLTRVPHCGRQCSIPLLCAD